MSTIAKDTGGGDFKKVPEGTHQAVCNMIVDLGNQVTTYMGDESIKRQVYIRWEVPDERVEYEVDGKKIEGPMSIGKTYTLSLGEKANLRKDLQGWRNKAFTPEELKGFDVENVLGACCQISVQHKESNGNVYANVTSVVGWPKGLDRINAENELIKYSQDDTSQFDSLPKWIKEKLGGSIQQQSDAPEPQDDFDDDIPF